MFYETNKFSAENCLCGFTQNTRETFLASFLFDKFLEEMCSFLLFWFVGLFLIACLNWFLIFWIALVCCFPSLLLELISLSFSQKLIAFVSSPDRSQEVHWMHTGYVAHLVYILLPWATSHPTMQYFCIITIYQSTKDAQTVELSGHSTWNTTKTSISFK